MSQTHSSQLQSRNHKIKSAMANINFIINASPPEVARALQGRLVKVKVQWEPLALRLKQRREQLLFEKKQTVSILFPSFFLPLLANCMYIHKKPYFMLSKCILLAYVLEKSELLKL